VICVDKKVMCVNDAGHYVKCESAHVRAERSGNGAERAENEMSVSRTVSGHSRRRLNVSGAWSGKPLREEWASQN